MTLGDEYRDRLGQRLVIFLDTYYRRIYTIDELNEYILSSEPIAIYFPAHIKPYCNLKCILRKKIENSFILDQTIEGCCSDVYNYKNMQIPFNYVTCFARRRDIEYPEYPEYPLHIAQPTQPQQSESKSKMRLVKLLKRMAQ